MTPLSCTPLPGTQDSVAPRMAPGWTPQGAPQASLLQAQGRWAPKLLTVSIQGTADRHPHANLHPGLQISPMPTSSQCSDTSMPSSPPTTALLYALCKQPPARGLSIVQFVLVDAGASGPWPAAGFEQQFSPGRVQLCFSPRLLSSRGSLPRDSHLPAAVPSPGSRWPRRFAESSPPRDTRAHTERIPTASPALPGIPSFSASPGTSRSWGRAGDNHCGLGPHWVWGHPGPPCTSLSPISGHRDPENGLSGVLHGVCFSDALGEQG